MTLSGTLAILLAKRARSIYRVPWDDAAMIVGGEENLLRLLALTGRSRKSTKSRKTESVPIQDIGKEIHEAWKRNQQVKVDAVRRQGWQAGYDAALEDLDFGEAARKAEVARRRQSRG